MKVVCCLSQFDEAVLRTWLLPGVTLRMVDAGAEAEHVRAQCEGADIVIGDTLHRVALDRRFLLALAPRAFVQQPSVGVDEIDLVAAADIGVTVSNAAGYNSGAVADWIVAAAYALVRGLSWRDAGIRGGEWPTGSPAVEMSSVTFGLVGLGAVGDTVAARIGAAVREVLYTDLREVDGPLRRVSLEQLLAGSDLVSVQVPLTSSTRGLLGKGEIATMRRGALLISAGRGGVVDEAALADAVVSGALGGAALDVFEREPLSRGSPLLGLDRVLLSPHVAGDTREANDGLARVVSGNVERVLRGDAPDHRVTA
jgi:phosphoglycerate dehydrogenase-like enzyme